MLSFAGLFGAFQQGLTRSSKTMQETYELKVHLACDEETGRWYIAESDIPGLWLEAADAASLMSRIMESAPEMIELNEQEILTVCRSRANAIKRPVGQYRLRPSIMPVFDSPVALVPA
jgi:hypothetical protein